MLGQVLLDDVLIFQLLAENLVNKDALLLNLVIELGFLLLLHFFLILLSLPFRCLAFLAHVRKVLLLELFILLHALFLLFLLIFFLNTVS